MDNNIYQRRRPSRGHSVVEVALLCPWIFFLLAGILDVGFYSYGLIAAENAARAAVEYTSKSTTTAADSAGACQYALDGLQALPNVRTLSSCSASPLIVSASKVTGADGSQASSVSVT